MSDAQFALLTKASPGGAAAADPIEASALCTLERLGLLAQQEAGVYVLTEAGRRYIAIEGPWHCRPT